MNPQLDDVPTPVEKKSQKKLVLIVGPAVLAVLVLGGYVTYQSNLKKQQDAAAIRLEAEKQQEAAKREAILKQSSVSSIEAGIDSEVSAIDEGVGQFTAGVEAQVRQEADQAEQIGVNNASNM